MAFKSIQGFRAIQGFRSRLSFSTGNGFNFGGDFPPSVGITIGAEPGFVGYNSNVGDLNPKEFLDTGIDITRIGATFSGSDWAINGDWAFNGDWSIGNFDSLVIGDGLPDVGDIALTVGGLSTVLSFNAGTYEASDSTAEAVFNLFAQSVGQTLPFTITISVAPPIYEGELIPADLSSLTGDPNSVGYYEGIGGSLTPPMNLGTPTDTDALYTLFGDPFGTGESYYVAIGADSPSDTSDKLFYFDGVGYVATYVGLYVIESETLYNYLKSRENQSVSVIVRNSEAPAGSTLTLDEQNFDWRFNSDGGTASGSLVPDILLDGQYKVRRVIVEKPGRDDEITVQTLDNCPIANISVSFDSDTIVIPRISGSPTSGTIYRVVDAAFAATITTNAASNGGVFNFTVEEA